jgi:uncharacterized protein (TIGR01777 family)
VPIAPPNHVFSLPCEQIDAHPVKSVSSINNIFDDVMSITLQACVLDRCLNMASQRVLVSGSTGLIGKALLKQLSPSHNFVSLVRSAPDGERVTAETAVQWRPDNPTQPLANESDLEFLEGCTAAVHLAGANLSSHRWTAAYKKTIRDSRIDSSRALVSILSRLQTPPKVLVCASAIGIYGDRGDEVLTEDSTHGSGFLPEVCEAWEASPDAAKGLGIRVVHLRFGVVLAPDGGAMAQLLPLFKSALGGRLGDGRQWMSWVTLTDVVRAIAFAISNEQAAGPFNVVTPNPISNGEFTRALAGEVHRPAPWVVPAFALKLAFGQMAEDTLLSSSRVLPARLQALGFNFLEPSIGPALHAMLYK